MVVSKVKTEQLEETYLINTWSEKSFLSANNLKVSRGKESDEQRQGIENIIGCGRTLLVDCLSFKKQFKYILQYF